jgi:glycerol kinase
VTDLVKAMTAGTDVSISEISAEGGPTHNAFLMQLQANLLGADIITTDVSDASALGAAVSAGFAIGLWTNTDEAARLKNITGRISPLADTRADAEAYEGWRRAVSALARISN